MWRIFLSHRAVRNSAGCDRGLSLSLIHPIHRHRTRLSTPPPRRSSSLPAPALSLLVVLYHDATPSFFYHLFPFSLSFYSLPLNYHGSPIQRVSIFSPGSLPLCLSPLLFASFNLAPFTERSNRSNRLEKAGESIYVRGGESQATSSILLITVLSRTW